MVKHWDTKYTFWATSHTSIFSLDVFLESTFCNAPVHGFAATIDNLHSTQGTELETDIT